jgi:hypothetical protein
MVTSSLGGRTTVQQPKGSASTLKEYSTVVERLEELARIRSRCCTSFTLVLDANVLRQSSQPLPHTVCSVERATLQ